MSAMHFSVDRLHQYFLRYFLSDKFNVISKKVYYMSWMDQFFQTSTLLLPHFRNLTVNITHFPDSLPNFKPSKLSHFLITYFHIFRFPKLHTTQLYSFKLRLFTLTQFLTSITLNLHKCLYKDLLALKHLELRGILISAPFDILSRAYRYHFIPSLVRNNVMSL